MYNAPPHPPFIFCRRVVDRLSISVLGTTDVPLDAAARRTLLLGVALPRSLVASASIIHGDVRLDCLKSTPAAAVSIVHADAAAPPPPPAPVPAPPLQPQSPSTSNNSLLPRASVDGDEVLGGGAAAGGGPVDDDDGGGYGGDGRTHAVLDKYYGDDDEDDDVGGVGETPSFGASPPKASKKGGGFGASAGGKSGPTALGSAQWGFGGAGSSLLMPLAIADIPRSARLLLTVSADTADGVVLAWTSTPIFDADDLTLARGSLTLTLVAGPPPALPVRTLTPPKRIIARARFNMHNRLTRRVPPPPLPPPADPCG